MAKSRRCIWAAGKRPCQRRAADICRGPGALRRTHTEPQKKKKKEKEKKEKEKKEKMKEEEEKERR